MPAKNITTSANIASLDDNIIVDMCAGKFFVDLSPSVFNGNGAALMLGAKVKIVNPYNVEVKPYGASYDIAAPFSSIYSFDIPTQARNYQYGRFSVSVQLTDADGTTYELTKPVITCAPDLQNPALNYRDLPIDIQGVCRDGKAYIGAAAFGSYRGLTASDSLVNLALDYPTASGLLRQNIQTPNFSVKLFEGVYKVSGTACVSYYAADNITFKISYKASAEKLLRCLVNNCAVYDRLAALHGEANNACDGNSRDNAIAVTLDAIRLLSLAQFAQDCGSDASEYITELESLLGIPPSQTGYPDYPMGNNQPSRDVSIQGVNVQKETAGLTDIYTIDNWIYTVTVTPNGGILTSSDPTNADDKTKVQVLTFDITKAYASIKNIISNSDSEKIYWASIVKQSLSGIDSSALGLTVTQFNSMSLRQVIQAILDKINACCNCTAKLLDHESVQQGADVLLRWTGIDTYGVDVYLDDQFMGTVLQPDSDIVLKGVATGVNRVYRLVPKCDKGTAGTVVQDSFAYLGCPTIVAPNLSTNNVNGVACPYNLATLLSGVPNGITIEWHTANNTLANTLVPQPTSVGSGIYYAFAKDNNNCYSPSNQVQVICQAAQCTSPQNMSVSAKTGGFLVQFQSATFPPPNNSYTVRRRAFTDPDLPASYTTLPAPVWNPTSNRWEVLDTAGQPNQEYTYVAMSNCGATQPFVTFNFSYYPACPVVIGLSASMG